MIERCKGNLLEADAEALVNTVNCVGVMGKGIALQFKEKFEENYKIYRKACKDELVQPGQMLIVPTGKLINPRYIINFPTKRHWKGSSRLEDVKAGLLALVKDIKELGIKSVALPPLGCGNGGLNWSEVEPLIERTFAKLPDVKVLLYPPQAAPKPAPVPGKVKTRMSAGRALIIKLLEQYAPASYKFSKLEIQKMAYFLQMAGQPLQLDFTKHTFGPYAKKMDHVLKNMEGSYTLGFGDGTSKSGIVLMEGAVADATDYLKHDLEALQRLSRVERLIEGYQTHERMELLGTVLMAAELDPPSADDAEAAIAFVHAWSYRKRHLFTAADIRAAWERLREQGWLKDLHTNASSRDIPSVS